MRILFPLLIVSIIAHINIIEAFNLAIFDQVNYANILTSSKITIAGFG
jgi:hypothetical protein